MTFPGVSCWQFCDPISFCQFNESRWIRFLTHRQQSVFLFELCVDLCDQCVSLDLRGWPDWAVHDQTEVVCDSDPVDSSCRFKGPCPAGEGLAFSPAAQGVVREQ